MINCIIVDDEQHAIDILVHYVKQTPHLNLVARFTNPIDDLGPHNPVSHPELAEFLTRSFAASDYDIRRLMRWLTLSQTFQLSSHQAEESFAIDDPQEGGTPLFSRAYPRPMGPEQVTSQRKKRPRNHQRPTSKGRPIRSC